MRAFFVLLFIITSFVVNAQTAYVDSMSAFIDNYIETHGVVQGHDKSHLSFYTIDKNYRTVARVEKTANSAWFNMKTSGLLRPLYRVYGVAHFKVNNDSAQLTIYQSQDLMQTEAYKAHLFIPFTDITSGTTSYAGGRYLDISMSDIQNNSLVLDFNKAYNPYCAYVTGVYNCPIPPKENALRIKIEAGEKTYSASH